MLSVKANQKIDQFANRLDLQVVFPSWKIPETHEEWRRYRKSLVIHDILFKTQEVPLTAKWFSGRSCIRIELEFGNVGFWGEGKPEYPEKNLSEQSREPTTNPTHIWRRVSQKWSKYLRHQTQTPGEHLFLDQVFW